MIKFQACDPPEDSRFFHDQGSGPVTNLKTLGSFMIKFRPCDTPEDSGFPHDGTRDDDLGLSCGSVHYHQAVVHVPDTKKENVFRIKAF